MLTFEALYSLLERIVDSNQILDDKTHELVTEAIKAYDEDQQDLLLNLLDNC